MASLPATVPSDSKTKTVSRHKRDYTNFKMQIKALLASAQVSSQNDVISLQSQSIDTYQEMIKSLIRRLCAVIRISLSVNHRTVKPTMQCSEVCQALIEIVPKPLLDLVLPSTQVVLKKYNDHKKVLAEAAKNPETKVEAEKDKEKKRTPKTVITGLVFRPRRFRSWIGKFLAKQKLAEDAVLMFTAAVENIMLQVMKHSIVSCQTSKPKRLRIQRRDISAALHGRDEDAKVRAALHQVFPGLIPNTAFVPSYVVPKK